jgi:uncharacterized protein DUF4440
VAAPGLENSETFTLYPPYLGQAAIPFKRGVMNKCSPALISVFALLLGVLLNATAIAQSVAPLDKIQNQEELNKAIGALDAALFDAYNKCDLATFGSLVDDNIEFYHDQGGVTLGRAALVEAVKKNICGQVTRELLPNTLQIYPMKGYGAIEMGVHLFHHPGHPENGDGEGKFVHLWQYKDGAWKVTRVLSYDHHAAGK